MKMLITHFSFQENGKRLYYYEEVYRLEEYQVMDVLKFKGVSMEP